MPATNKFIREAIGTEAQIKALPARVPAQTTDTDKYYICSSDGTKVHEFAYSRYWNGAAWVYEDARFDDVVSSSLAIGGHTAIWHDRIAFPASSVTYRDLQAGTNNTTAIAEITVTGKYDSTGLYHRKLAHNFSFSYNVMYGTAIDDLYDDDDIPADPEVNHAISFSFGAIGSDNKFRVQINNNRTSQFCGAIKYDFFLCDGAGLTRL